MHYKTFDTHKYIKSLQETGFNEQQAEILVKSLLESRDFDLSILATREQVAEVKSDLQKNIAQLDSKLSREISATREQVSEVKSDLQKEISVIKHDILKWMIPLILTVIAFVAGIAVKLFI
jgi:phosphopantetheine adenylyltransferase